MATTARASMGSAFARSISLLLLASPGLAHGGFSSSVAGQTVTLSPPQAPYPCTTGNCNYSSTTYSSARLDGNQLSSAAGSAIVVADFNGDGWSDLAVGAPNADLNKGRVYVHYGTSSAPATTINLGGASVVGLVGQASNDLMGSVLAACDVTGDARVDLIIGDPDAGSQSGNVYILPGSSNGVRWPSSSDISTFPGLVTLSGGAQADRAGAAVTCGDLDGDGEADLVVGAPGASAVHIVYGPVTSSLLTSEGRAGSRLVLLGTPGDETGASVALAADVGGDGLPAVIVGAPMASSSGGMAWIVGNVDGESATTVLEASTSRKLKKIVGNLAFVGASVGALGFAVAGAGDIDGDGFGDILVAAPAAPRTSSLFGESGRLYVIFGASDLYATDTVAASSLGTFFYGESEYDRLGTAVVAVGDVDHDGFDDLLVSSPGTDLSGSGPSQAYGAAYLLAGRKRTSWGFAASPTGLPIFSAGDQRNIRFLGRIAGDRAGSALYGSVELDLDHDDYHDFLVGAPGVDVSSVSGASGEGRVYLFSFGDFQDRDVDGQSRAQGDCDDKDLAVRYVASGATEVCDGGKDNDCDGKADDADTSVAGTQSYYLDADGDGYGDPARPIARCASAAPVGYSAKAGDCDDSNPLVNPTAQEVCDPADRDEDCDGLVDDADPGVSISSRVLFYSDSDLDGYGAAQSEGTASCNAPAPTGWSANQMDCDDGDPSVNPGMEEVCGGGDEDCDGLVDDADDTVLEQQSYYPDLDWDGYGNAFTFPLSACTDPSSPGDLWTTDNRDCDDQNAGQNPGAAEICDAANVDDDCDGLADDADPEDAESGQTRFWPDVDKDGYGDAASSSLLACDAPHGGGYAENDTDCDDRDVYVHPASTETCDGKDNDCDGSVDEVGSESQSSHTWYADLDGDGYGELSAPRPSCDPVPSAGTTSLELATDCDDGAADIHPGAAEGTEYDAALGCLLADGIDNDCDGATDEDTCSADDDKDGSSELNGDCADSAPEIHPDTPEQCDAIDQDCDGNVVNGFDQDGDGYLVASSACGAAGDDCDDEDADTHPGAAELCDGKDNDCDGQVSSQGGTAEQDGDHDGARGCDGDCDDQEPAAYPGAQELCDGIDNDCNGNTDADAPDALAVYPDLDGDGHGDAIGQVIVCTLGDQESTSSDDCNDGDPSSYPGAPQVCDGLDHDCDRAPDLESPRFDSDADGFLDGLQCQGLAQTYPLDCNDADGAIHPGAVEVLADGIDNNCDGLLSEGSSVRDDALGCAYMPGARASWPGTAVLAALALVPLSRRRRRHQTSVAQKSATGSAVSSGAHLLPRQRHAP